MATTDDISWSGIVEHVPTPDLRAWRELVTRRRNLVQRRSEAKNDLRALLRRAGITPPRSPGVWTKAGRVWLAGLSWPTRGAALQRDTLLREIQSLDRQVRQVEAELRQIASNSPAVLRLVRMTGFGFRTAEAVLAALEEWRRQRP